MIYKRKKKEEIYISCSYVIYTVAVAAAAAIEIFHNLHLMNDIVLYHKLKKSRNQRIEGIIYAKKLSGFRFELVTQIECSKFVWLVAGFDCTHRLALRIPSVLADHLQFMDCKLFSFSLENEKDDNEIVCVIPKHFVNLIKVIQWSHIGFSICLLSIDNDNNQNFKWYVFFLFPPFLSLSFA